MSNSPRHKEMRLRAHSHFKESQIILIGKVEIEGLNGEPKAQIL